MSRFALFSCLMSLLLGSLLACGAHSSSIVHSAPIIAYSPASLTLQRGTAMSQLTPTNTGGPVESWSVSPALPAGLSLNTGTGIISGTPTVVTALASYTVTATNIGGSATVTLSLTVNEAPPSGLSYGTNPATYVRGTAIPANGPSSGGGAVVNYSVSPALPAGLSLSTSTGAITGTPTVITSTTAYTVTATNTGGSTTATLTITVNDLAPSALTYSTNPAVYTKGTAIPANSPSSGGGAVVSYSVSPALPAGLNLNTGTGIINGTPTVVTATASFTITATNSGGSTNASLSITVNDAAPTTPTISADTYATTGKAGLVATTPDQGTGVTYAWTISGGTITAGQGTRLLTYSAGAVGTLSLGVTATNGGSSSSSSVSVTVVPAPTAELFLPTSVHPGDAWMKASTPAQAGMTYLWSILPGTAIGSVSSGQGSTVVNFSSGSTEGTFQVQVDVQNPAGDHVTATRTVTVQTGTWLIKDGSAVPRKFATSTTLASGRVLVTGGINGVLGPMSRTDIYDPSTGLWVVAGALNAGRAYHTASLLPDGKVLVVGGDNAPNPTAPISRLASAELFDPATGTWATTGSLSVSRALHTATVLPDGRVLVAGGNSSSGAPLNHTEIWDPTTGNWSTAGIMPASHQQHTATLLPSGKVLIAGGYGVAAGSGVKSVQWSAEIYDLSTGLWTGTGSLGTARWRHIAALLPDGRVLVAGGNATANMNYLADAEIYDPSTGTWSSTGSLHMAREYHSGTVLKDGRVLVAGGRQAGGELASSEIFDPTQGTWSTTAGSLAWPRYFHGSALLSDGRVMVDTGAWTANDTPLATSEFFDPAAGTWSASPAGLSPSIYSHTAAQLPGTGKVLVVGGVRPGTGISSNQAILFDPATGTWTTTGSLGLDRSTHTATVLSDGRILVAGGYGSAGILKSTEIYDPATGTWTATGSLNTERQQHTATLLPSGKVLVAGGYTNGGYTATAEIYDPSTQAWTALPPLGTARGWHTATLLANGKVLVAGGWNSSGALLSATLFDPALQTWAAAGGLNATRYDFAATLLTDGKVLVVGGTKDYTNAETYNPATNSWTYTGPMSIDRRGTSAILLDNGKVLVSGGNSWTNLSKTVFSEIFDPVARTWTTSGALNVDRYYHTATHLTGLKTVVAISGILGDVVTEIYMP